MNSATKPRNAARQLIFAGLILLLAMSAVPVKAQDWSFNPQVGVGAEINDNAQLSFRTDDIVKLQGLLVGVAADVTYRSEITDFLIGVLAKDRKYSSDSDFDSTFITALLRYNAVTPMNTFKIDAQIEQDDIRKAERVDQNLDTTEPDDIRDDDTALVQIPGERTRWAIRPSWTYRWSDVSSTRLQINYRDVSYNEEFLLLKDYSDAALSANYQRHISDRTAVFINGAVRHYESDDRTIEFDNSRIDIGVNTDLTSKLKLRARIGIESVEPANTDLKEDVTIGELTFIQRLETIHLLAQYRRSVSTSGTGRMSVRDAFNLNLTRNLSERFAAGIGVRAYATNPIDFTDGTGTIFGRDFVELTARFTWNISRTIAMQTTYRYTILDQEIVGESANSNEITVWFTYRPSGTQGRL